MSEIDVTVTPEQFMRDANADARAYNERVLPQLRALGIEISDIPLPYPDTEKS